MIGVVKGFAHSGKRVGYDGINFTRDLVGCFSGIEDNGPQELILAQKKYTVAGEGPRIEQFLNHVFKLAGFSLQFTVAEGETPHPDFENPDLMVRFTGADVDILLQNKTELLKN